MKRIPEIAIQIVHIEGPLKGTIQDFTESVVQIGRKPSCHIHFPTDLDYISRTHAEIVREGNRFKLIDKSANGTFLNGKEVSEAYIKDGDILMFAEGGPKVSFLTTHIEADATAQSSPPLVEEFHEPPPPSPDPITQHHEHEAIQPDALPRAPEHSPPSNIKAPLDIQYGPTIKSFKELPITIGQNPDCDYPLAHPQVMPQHVQIYYAENQYVVKDLTGKHLVMIDDVPIQHPSPLPPSSRLSLTPRGPKFLFISGGRLAEIEEPEEEKVPDEISEVEDAVPESNSNKKRAKSILKKLWSG